MRRNINDLHLVMILLMLASLAVMLPLNIPLLRAVLSLPLALLLPGYALTSAIFPNTTLGVPERLMAAIGLSLVLLVLGGILLHYTPQGLQTNSWVILLYGLTLIATIFALIRRSGMVNVVSGTPVPIFALREGLLIITASAIIVLALLASYNGVVNQPEPGFTQLWILPDEPHIIRVGVRNAEQHTMEYRLELMMRGKIIAAWSKIALLDGQSWEKSFEIPGSAARAKEVQAFLYTTDQPETIYRRVELWLTAPE